MMFDPPDYPYKELNESIGNYYGPDLLFSTETTAPTDSIITPTHKDLLEVTEQMITNVENQLLYHSNETGRFFDAENTYLSSLESNSAVNTELYIVQSENTLFNNENTLLDDNTVNQFLLPQKTSENDKETVESSGPDLLSLHSCVICHEIFSTDVDLLDHTISVHASFNIVTEEANSLSNSINEDLQRSDLRSYSNSEGDWLVCSICERVLSTAVEVVSTEGLCCNDADGRTSVTPRKMDTMFVCDFCSGLFANPEALDRHRRSCDIQEPQTYYGTQTDPNLNMTQTYEQFHYPCATCGKQCTTAHELKKHQSACPSATTKRNIKRTYQPNTSSKMWNCGSCNQLFSTARELYRHKRGEDRPAGVPLMAFVCEECDKVLGSMCALHTHKKMHKVSKPGYPCQICGRRFNQSGHLAIHMRMHTGERPYPCDLCPKAFKVKVERDDHRRTHTGERPFACTSCPKTFTAAARLREHARIHTDQRPYQCDVCGASFRRPYARTVHTLIHTGEKPHECDICGTTFRRSGDMWKHKRTLHGIQATSDISKKS